jgi:DNA processing protein
VTDYQLRYKIALTYLSGFGPKKVFKLLSCIETPEVLFKDSFHSLAKKTGFKKEALGLMHRENALEKADKQIKFIDKNQLDVHFYLDNTFPRRLRNCEDSPILIYTKGNLKTNPQRSVAIVGTRNATNYGKNICEHLIYALKTNDIQVISGLAYGIDAYAHQLCVEKNIETVAVLGHGMDRIYPVTHKKLALKMLSNGGLISEFPSGTKPDKENFPKRNRIVAGMADAVIVVESKSKGGSLITAELANDYNKDVFAFPGNVDEENSQGCNNLIASNKAHLITSCADFLKIMGWGNLNQANQMLCNFEMSGPESTIFNLLLANNKTHIDVLSVQAKTPVSQISAILFQLELKGAVKKYVGNMYGINQI